jgi:hypothetical protein
MKSKKQECLSLTSDGHRQRPIRSVTSFPKRREKSNLARNGGIKTPQSGSRLSLQTDSVSTHYSESPQQAYYESILLKHQVEGINLNHTWFAELDWKDLCSNTLASISELLSRGRASLTPAQCHDVEEKVRSEEQAAADKKALEQERLQVERRAEQEKARKKEGRFFVGVGTPLFFVSLLFVIAGVWVLSDPSSTSDDRFAGWIGVVFFGFGVVVGFGMIVGGLKDLLTEEVAATHERPIARPKTLHIPTGLQSKAPVDGSQRTRQEDPSQLEASQEGPENVISWMMTYWDENASHEWFPKEDALRLAKACLQYDRNPTQRFVEMIKWTQTYGSWPLNTAFHSYDPEAKSFTGVDTSVNRPIQSDVQKLLHLMTERRDIQNVSFLQRVIRQQKPE